MGLPAMFEEVHAAARAALLRLNELPPLAEFPGEAESACTADGAPALAIATFATRSGHCIAKGEASRPSFEENESARPPKKLGKTDALRSARVARSAVSRH